MASLSYLEHYSGTYGGYVRDRRFAGSMPLVMFEILQPAGDFPDPPVNDLVIIELKSAVRGRWDFGGGRHRAAEAGLINVVPPQQPTDVVIDHPHMLRAFAVPGHHARVRLEESFNGVFPDFSRLQFPGTRNPLLRVLLDRLWTAGADGGELGTAFADSAVLTLLFELAREAGQSVKLAKGGLSPLQLRQVRDFVESSLDRDVALADLAEAAGLSPFHFSRAFKKTTGMSPFQFLSKRRIARAQHLLRSTDLPLWEVALSCGFAGQASFTAAFHRETGCTPSRWRRDCRQHCA